MLMKTATKTLTPSVLRWRVRGVTMPDPYGMFGSSWYELGVFYGEDEQDAIEACRQTIPDWQLTGLKLEADLIED